MLLSHHRPGAIRTCQTSNGNIAAMMNLCIRVGFTQIRVAFHLTIKLWSYHTGYKEQWVVWTLYYNFSLLQTSKYCQMTQVSHENETQENRYGSSIKTSEWKCEIRHMFGEARSFLKWNPYGGDKQMCQCPFRVTLQETCLDWVERWL